MYPFIPSERALSKGELKLFNIINLKCKTTYSMHGSHISHALPYTFILFIHWPFGMRKVVVFTRLLTQSTSVFKKHVLNYYSCVLMSLCNWVVENQCNLYLYVYLSFGMD